MLGILYGWRKRNEGEVFKEESVRAALIELPQGTASVGCGLSPHWRCCHQKKLTPSLGSKALAKML
jgi:hypothetical protein